MNDFFSQRTALRGKIPLGRESPPKKFLGESQVGTGSGLARRTQTLKQMLRNVPGLSRGQICEH